MEIFVKFVHVIFMWRRLKFSLLLRTVSMDQVAVMQVSPNIQAGLKNPTLKNHEPWYLYFFKIRFYPKPDATRKSQNYSCQYDNHKQIKKKIAYFLQ